MRTLTISAAILLFAIATFSQEKTNEEINRQIRSLGVDHTTVSYDEASKTSKLMAVSENFSNHDAGNAGVLAVNFAMAFFFSGDTLKAPAETVHLAFWVLTNKPRFADDHHLTVELDGRSLDLGDARYAYKPNQRVEYLNFEISRADLAAIGSSSKVTFNFGPRAFTATRPQVKLILAVARIADSSSQD